MDEYCRCGRVAVQRTAWIESNARRRFVGCVRGSLGCNYFRWIDDPVCHRGRVVIYGLRERVRVLEEEMVRIGSLREDGFEAQRQGHGSYWFYVGLALVFVVIFLSNNNVGDH